MQNGKSWLRQLLYKPCVPARLTFAGLLICTEREPNVKSLIYRDYMNFEKKVIAIGLTTRRNPFHDSSIGDGGTRSL